MIVHRHFETLLEHVPLKYMPNDYGGESPSLIELHGNTLLNINIFFFLNPISKDIFRNFYLYSK